MTESSIFWNAVKETPRLYFAPIRAMMKSLFAMQIQVQNSMSQSVREGHPIVVEGHKHSRARKGFGKSKDLNFGSGSLKIRATRKKG